MERYKKCCDSDVSSMQRVAGITHSEVHWIFHHLAQSLDSPLYLTNFQIVTVCVGACVRENVCACVNFFSRHSSICYLLGYLLRLYYDHYY